MDMSCSKKLLFLESVVLNLIFIFSNFVLSFDGFLFIKCLMKTCLIKNLMKIRDIFPVKI